MSVLNLAKLQTDLIRDEALKLYPYRDTVGKLTIGVGRNLTDNGISKAEALTLLQNDIEEIVAELSKENFWPIVSQYEVRARALVNMAFNLGHAHFFQFTDLISALLRSDWERAAAEMLDSRWAEQVGARAVRLAEMMRTGQDVN